MTLSTLKHHIKPTLSNLSLALATVVFMPSIATAAEDVLYGKIEVEGRAAQNQIVFVPFSGDPTLSNVILNDLQSTGLSSTTKGLIGQPHSSAELGNSLPAWQQVDGRYLVIGSSLSNQGNVEVDFEVIEIATGTIKGRGTQTGRGLAEAAHKAAGQIYKIITGKESDLNARIAYVKEENTGKNKTSSLVLSDTNGSNPTVIARVTNASIYSPDVSPNGEYIVYSVQFEDNHPQLFRQNLKYNTAKVEKVTDLKGSQLSPTYSPDGQYILFSSTADGDADIYQVNSSGGTARKILDRAYDQVEPSYDPSDSTGQSFFFASDHASPNRPNIYQATGGAIRRISRSGYAANPDISVDGSKIAFLNGNRANIMNSSGSVIANYGSTGIDEAPRFSPNGERVVYSQGSGNSTIVVRPVSGGQPQSFRVNGTAKSPVWVPGS